MISTIKKWVKRKEEAFKYGTNCINNLQGLYDGYVNNQLGEDKKSYGDKFIGLNVIDVTNWLYRNDLFYEYVKYSFIAKFYEKKLNFIKFLIIFVDLFLGIISYVIFDLGLIFTISFIILVLALIIIFKILKFGESYSSYYKRTFLSFLLGIYGISFTLNKSGSLLDDEINEIVRQRYDKKKITSSMDFKNSFINGKITELSLIKVLQKRDNNGNVRKQEEKIFDGFYLKINVNNNNNLLRGNTIKILADENMLSSLTEDTVKGIYESQKEFSFNSEEMNKSFDCKVSGYNGFVDIDDMLITVHKIITPSFEQHLLYLRERYNTFSMNISDNGVVATFNMERNFLQKVKHKELMDFKTTYREANEDFRMLRADDNGIDDFAYYNVFPFLERLYLIKYLSYLYLSYTDFDNYYDLNNESINSFEEQMKNIFIMNNKDFKEINVEKLKEIKNSTKENVQNFLKKENK